jgi:hypothetical protein
VSVGSCTERPIAVEGGVTTMTVATGRDPYEALDDLMTVIETLCPVWPTRAPFCPDDRFWL